MKKLLIALPIVSLIVTGCQLTPNSNNNPATPTGTINSSTSTNNSTGTNLALNPSAQKFSDSADYANAHLISGVSLDSAAQQALVGFQLSKQTLPDGSTQINLKATESGYQDQQYTLKSDQQLYFIDRTPGDDRGTEKFTGDDYGVVVDSQGLIVSGGQ